MKLLIQPEDGIAPLVAAIKGARKSVHVVIFRLDRAEIEAALTAAAKRGVQVTALITHANEGGEKSLRKLEMRLLEQGVTVSRTSDDLVRYHDKLLIIDRRVLYVMSFNFTHLDVDHSRGFAIVTKKKKLVSEALKLLAADNDRSTYEAGADDFVVSPVNARQQLLALIHRAHKELLIYDPNIADAEMLRALDARARHGVRVRIIGSVGRKSPRLNVRPLGGFRLHTRTIIRDGCEGFVGSQSLREAELNSRREVGVIVRHAKVVAGLVDTFEADWSAKETIESVATLKAARHALKRNLKANMKKLSPLDPLVREALREVVSKTDGSATLTTREMKDTVEKAVREAVRERVQEMLSESSEQ
ncbi:MAG TPA: phospholipase D-like domain-containing protein [Vicinamibacterales bacterium]|nr:phospholipase D-like domain-containing protein [Vicinamibacterales bacterium]